MTTAIVPKELLTATLGGLSLLVVSGGTDRQVLTQQADGTYAPEAVSAGIGGSVGSKDNRLVRSDGTGGSTVQSTGITVDDSNNVSGIGTITVNAISHTYFSMPANGSAVFGRNVTTINGYDVVSSGNVKANLGYYVEWNYGGCSLYSGTSSAIIAYNNARSAFADFSVRSLTQTGGSNIAGITKAALLLLTPNASSAGRWRVTDATPASREAYPDGTNWRYTSDDTVVT